MTSPPVVRNSTPSPLTGEGIVVVDALWPHTSVPVFASYAQAPLSFWYSTAALPPWSNASGVTQLMLRSRFTFQTFLPVFLSMPAANESPSLSIGTHNTSPARMGDDAM